MLLQPKSTWPGKEGQLQGKPVDILGSTCLGAWGWWIMDTKISQCHASEQEFVPYKISSFWVQTLLKHPRHWDPAFFVNNQRKHLQWMAEGHSMRLTWTCPLKNPRGKIFLPSFPIRCILQNLDQNLLLKGIFNSVGLLWTSSATLLSIKQDKLVCSQGQAEFVPGLLKMLLQYLGSPQALVSHHRICFPVKHDISFFTWVILSLLSMFSEREFTENDLCSAVHAASSHSNEIFLLPSLKKCKS